MASRCDVVRDLVEFLSVPYCNEVVRRIGTNDGIGLVPSDILLNSASPATSASAALTRRTRGELI
jgi:hypothetical protein